MIVSRKLNYCTGFQTNVDDLQDCFDRQFDRNASSGLCTNLVLSVISIYLNVIEGRERSSRRNQTVVNYSCI